MSEGQGSISFNNPGGTPAGFINIRGARNGTSIDGLGFVVLGQDVGAAGDPAKLLNSRQIPMNGFGIQFQLFPSIYAISQALPAMTSYLKGQGNQQLQEIYTIQGVNPLPGQPYGNFWWNLDETFINPDGQRDAVIQFAYNLDGSGHLVNLNEAGFGWNIESHFERAGVGTFEYYITSIAKDGSVARYLAIDASKNSVSATGFLTVENWQHFSVTSVGNAYYNIGPGVVNYKALAGDQVLTMSSFGAGTSTFSITTTNDGTGDNTINGSGGGRFHFTGASAHFDSPGSADGFDFLFRNTASNTANHLFDVVNHTNTSVLSIIENTGNLLLKNDTYNAGVDTGQTLQVIGDTYVSGKLGVGQTAITARLHLPAGSAAAGTGPVKFTRGPVTAVVEQGLVEYDATGQLYFTPAATRNNILVGLDGAAAPATTLGVAIANFYGTSAANFLGNPNSWAAVVIAGTTYKIPLYT